MEGFFELLSDLAEWGSHLAAATVAFVQRRRGTDRVWYEGVPLPPPSIRVGGQRYMDDAFFVGYADSDARRLIEQFHLDETTRVLDVGCGQCRLAIGLMRQLPTVGRYVGLDLDPASIDWGSRHLTAIDPAFEFRALDVHNERYNPEGRPLDETFRFPFADDAFDLVYMAGVSPHLDADEHRIYLREFARVLSPGGGLYLTAFVEEHVPPVTVNPEGYLGEPLSGPRNCIRYERGFFLSLLRDAGFRIERFEHRAGQFGMSWIAAALDR